MKRKLFCRKCKYAVLSVSADPTGPTNEGTKFVVGFMDNAENAASRSGAFLYVGNTQNNPAQVTVSVPNDEDFPNYPQSVTLQPGDRSVFTFSATGDDDIRVTTTLQRSKGILVESTIPVTVIGTNDEDISTDSFLALPCQTVQNNEYKYFVFSGRTNSSDPSTFLIVACEDNTEVTLNINDGTSTTSTLSQYQTLNYQSPIELTGSFIVSDKPISVFTGHKCGRIPGVISACDHLVEQVPMHAVWGQTFLAVPFGLRRSGDIFRVGSLIGDNQVNYTCTRMDPDPQSPNPIVSDTKMTTIAEIGDYIEIRTASVGSTANQGVIDDYRREFCCIETSKPAIVMQYMLGHSVDEVDIAEIGNGIGDPSIALVPPMEQYRNDLFLSTVTETIRPFNEFITWAVPSAFFVPETSDEEGFLLNGNVLRPGSRDSLGSEDYVPIYCSNRQVCGYGAISRISNEQGRTLTYNNQRDSNAAFYSVLYGFLPEQSFAYSSGYEMEPIGRKKCIMSLLVYL